MLSLSFYPLVLWILPIAPALADVINLASLKWTLTNSNGTINIPSTGPPNEAHVDLLNAGIITEPLLGVNGSNFLSLIPCFIFIQFTHRFYATLDC